MLSPRLTNCPECANIPSLLKKIDCKLAELGNNLYNNVSYMLNKPIPAGDILQLIGYRRILTHKYCNPNYAHMYSVNMIASKVIRLTVGCVSRCNTPEPCLEEPCDITVVPNPSTTTTSSSSTSSSSTTTTTTTTIGSCKCLTFYNGDDLNQEILYIDCNGVTRYDTILPGATNQYCGCCVEAFNPDVTITIGADCIGGLCPEISTTTSTSSTSTTTSSSTSSTTTTTTTFSNNPIINSLVGLKIETIYIDTQEDLALLPSTYIHPCPTQVGVHNCNRAFFEINANNIYVGDSLLNNSNGIDGKITISGKRTCVDYLNTPAPLTGGTWNGTYLSRYSEIIITGQQAINIANVNPGNCNIEFKLISTMLTYNAMCDNESQPHQNVTWIRISKPNGTVIYNNCPVGNITTINIC